jgi:hypothetical protein
MSDPARMPPRHVSDAAAVVDQWLKSVEPTAPKSAAEIARMSPGATFGLCAAVGSIENAGLERPSREITNNAELAAFA